MDLLFSQGPDGRTTPAIGTQTSVHPQLYPSTAPQQLKYPGTAPQQLKYPSTAPQQLKYRSTVPQQSKYPSTAPQQLKYPSTAPQQLKYPSTAPQQLPAGQQTQVHFPVLTKDDVCRSLPSAAHVALTNQQTFSDPRLPSLGMEEDLPIPDFNHLPSSLEEQNVNIHTNSLRSAIFQTILNSYPRLSRKFQRSQYVVKKFQKAPSNLPTCLYQTSPSSSSTDDLAIGNLASDTVNTDEEGDNGYFSFNDNSQNSCKSISPNSCSSAENFDDVSVKNDFEKFEDIFHLDSTSDDLSHPSDLSVTKPMPTTSIAGPKPVKYQCPICEKSYRGNTNLNYHMATHTGIRPHKCSVCGKAFTQKSTLRTHFRIHTGEKPYQCRTCSRSFADYSTCMKHERTHSGEKPYPCPICGKCFAQSGNMLRHRQIHSKRTELNP